MNNSYFEITWVDESGRKKYNNKKAFFIDFFKANYNDLKREIFNDYEYKNLLRIVMTEAAFASIQEEWKKIEENIEKLNRITWGEKEKDEK
jgi:hypothetical protein